jgi:hypothetical protein
MTRTEIITELKKYFSISELVCPHTLQSFGETAWQFLRIEQLHNLLVVRKDILQVPMTINNYPKGSFTQRGLRCNLCQIVKDKTDKNQIYLSAHTMGGADDFDAQGLNADKTRAKILQKQMIMPYPFRLELNVSWVHLDSYDPCNGKSVNLFNSI